MERFTFEELLDLVQSGQLSTADLELLHPEDAAIAQQMLSEASQTPTPETPAQGGPLETMDTPDWLGPAMMGARPLSTGAGHTLRGLAGITRPLMGAIGATAGARLIPGAPFAGASVGSQAGRVLEQGIIDPIRRLGEYTVELSSKEPTTRFVQDRAYSAAQEAEKAARAATGARQAPTYDVSSEGVRRRPVVSTTVPSEPPPIRGPVGADLYNELSGRAVLSEAEQKVLDNLKPGVMQSAQGRGLGYAAGAPGGPNRPVALRPPTTSAGPAAAPASPSLPVSMAPETISNLEKTAEAGARHATKTALRAATPSLLRGPVQLGMRAAPWAGGAFTLADVVRWIYEHPVTPGAEGPTTLPTLIPPAPGQ